MSYQATLEAFSTAATASDTPWEQQQQQLAQQHSHKVQLWLVRCCMGTLTPCMHMYVLCLHRCSGASWLLLEDPWTGSSLSDG